MNFRKLFLTVATVLSFVGTAFAGEVPDPPDPPPPAAYQAPATIRNTSYVSATGVGTGATADAPMSLAAACLAAGPKDVIYILPGDYSAQSFAPDSSGTSDNEIQYIGDVNNPESVIMPNFSTSRSYLTIKGMTFQGAINLYRGTAGVTADSAKVASHVWISRGSATSVGFYGAQNCRVDHMTINSVGGTAITFSGGLSGAESATLDGSTPRQSAAQYDSLLNCVITTGIITPTATYGFVMKAFANHNLIKGNTVTSTLRYDGTKVCQRALYNSRTNAFTENRWVTSFPSLHEDRFVYEGSGPASAFWLSDSSRSNTFTRDTILAGDNSGYPGISADLIHINNTTWNGQCTGNVWNFCRIETSAGAFVRRTAPSAKNFLTGSTFKATADFPAITFKGCADTDTTTALAFKNWYIVGNTFSTRNGSAYVLDRLGSCESSAIVDTSFISQENVFVSPIQERVWTGIPLATVQSIWGLEAHSLVGTP